MQPRPLALRRRLLRSLAHAAPALPLALSGRSAGAQGQLVVRLGHVAALSGPAAHMGKDIDLGVRLAIRDLNDIGVKLGKQIAHFELVTEDEGSDPRAGVEVAVRMVNARVRGVVGHMTSGSSLAAARIYADAGIPQITAASTAAAFTQRGHRTAFRVVAHDGQLGALLARHAARDLKLRSIVLIDDRTPYGEGLAEDFARAVKAAGGRISARESLPRATANDADLARLVGTFKGLKADLVFFAGLDSAGAPLLRQMRAQGNDLRLMGGDGICTPEFARLAGDALVDDRVICAEGGAAHEGSAALKAWQARFRDKTGQDVQFNAPYGYDAVMVMAEAMKKAGSAESRAWLPELARIDYRGVTGRIAFDAKGDLREPAVTIYTFRKGSRTPLKVVRL